MSELKHRVELSVGDWSRDGHNISESLFIMSNLTGKQMEKAYKKGVKVCGLDVEASVAAEYEDSVLREEDFEKLKAAGFPFEAKWEMDLRKTFEEIYLDEDMFCDLYLFVVKLGDPKFEHEYIKTDYNNIVRVGGYGLFQP